MLLDSSSLAFLAFGWCCFAQELRAERRMEELKTRQAASAKQLHRLAQSLLSEAVKEVTRSASALLLLFFSSYSSSSLSSSCPSPYSWVSFLISSFLFFFFFSAVAFLSFSSSGADRERPMTDRWFTEEFLPSASTCLSKNAEDGEMVRKREIEHRRQTKRQRGMPERLDNKRGCLLVQSLKRFLP